MARIALTFDAEHPDRPLCPPGNAERILDALHDRKVRATFFVQGRWAEAYPATARRIADEGHLIGNHSKYHARMTLLSEQGFRTDVTEAAAAIQDATGVDPKPWFRCPFGDGRDDPRVLSALKDLGYEEVGWDVVLDDWEPWRTAAEITADAVAGSLAHGDGAVILMHTWPGPTGEAVPEMVERMAAAGASFVAIDELKVAP